MKKLILIAVIALTACNKGPTVEEARATFAATPKGAFMLAIPGFDQSLKAGIEKRRANGETCEQIVAPGGDKNVHPYQSADDKAFMQYVAAVCEAA